MLQIGGVVLVVVLAAFAIQHLRYLRHRRVSAQDRQRLLHPGDAFHVMTFFKVNSGQRIVDSARRFRQEVMRDSKARLIYAGQAGFTLGSAQMEHCDWDGVILFEYPSRISFVQSSMVQHSDAARAVFAESYVHGMQRNRRQGLIRPALLLKLRLQNILSGNWRIPSLKPMPGFDSMPEYNKWRGLIARLRSLQKVNGEGLVIYNLIKQGSVEQQAVESTYNEKVLSRMAALGHGPLHAGRSVAVGGNARFDQVYIEHYPSATYYAEWLSSRFFQENNRYRQLTDAMSVPTAPITDRL